MLKPFTPGSGPRQCVEAFDERQSIVGEGLQILERSANRCSLCFVLVFDFGKLTTEFLRQSIDTISPPLTSAYYGCLHEQTLPSTRGA